MGWKLKYVHIPHLESLKPTPRILLGRILFWTEKKDGECVALWLKDDKVQISSRNQEDASSDIKNKVSVICKKDYDKCIALLRENPQFVLYVEECMKGRSVTGAEFYDEPHLYLFDIYDLNVKRYLNYTAVHQHAYHHKIPVVKLYAKTRHRSMKDLLKFANHVLSYCKEIEIEGMVIKPQKPYITTPNGWDLGYVQAKVKLDVPKPKKRKIARGKPIYPPIPENEILGAINKAHQDLGNEAMKEVSKAMPLIAKYVGEECKKHFYSKPTKKLFIYYKKYLERLI